MNDQDLDRILRAIVAIKVEDRNRSFRDGEVVWEESDSAYSARLLRVAREAAGVPAPNQA